MLELVKFDDMGDRSFEERAVVTDKHDTARKGRDEFFETSEAIEIEIIRWFIEQIHIET